MNYNNRPPANTSNPNIKMALTDTNSQAKKNQSPMLFQNPPNIQPRPLNYRPQQYQQIPQQHQLLQQQPNPNSRSTPYNQHQPQMQFPNRAVAPAQRRQFIPTTNNNPYGAQNNSTYLPRQDLNTGIYTKQQLLMHKMHLQQQQMPSQRSDIEVTHNSTIQKRIGDSFAADKMYMNPHDERDAAPFTDLPDAVERLIPYHLNQAETAFSSSPQTKEASDAMDASLCANTRQLMDEFDRIMQNEHNDIVNLYSKFAGIISAPRNQVDTTPGSVNANTSG